MSIYVLSWLKEDLEKQGKSLNDFKLIELKEELKKLESLFN